MRATGASQAERSRGAPLRQRATAATSGDAGVVADVARRSGTTDVRRRLIAAKLELSRDRTLEPSKEATREPTREPISAASSDLIAGDALSVVARACSVRLRRFARGATMTTDRRPDINRLSCLAN